MCLPTDFKKLEREGVCYDCLQGRVGADVQRETVVYLGRLKWAWQPKPLAYLQLETHFPVTVGLRPLRHINPPVCKEFEFAEKDKDPRKWKASGQIVLGITGGLGSNL